MKQPAPVYQVVAGHQWRISGFLAIYTVVLSSCAANYGIVVLIVARFTYLVGRRYPSRAAKFTLSAVTGTTLGFRPCGRGNHEDMAMDALVSRRMSLWLMNGGDWFIALADNQQKQAKTALEKCQHLPFILEVHKRYRQRCYCSCRLSR